MDGIRTRRRGAAAARLRGAAGAAGATGAAGGAAAAADDGAVTTRHVHVIGEGGAGTACDEGGAAACDDGDVDDAAAEEVRADEGGAGTAAEESDEDDDAASCLRLRVGGAGVTSSADDEDDEDDVEPSSDITCTGGSPATLARTATWPRLDMTYCTRRASLTALCLRWKSGPCVALRQWLRKLNRVSPGDNAARTCSCVVA